MPYVRSVHENMCVCTYRVYEINLRCDRSVFAKRDNIYFLDKMSKASMFEE